MSLYNWRFLRNYVSVAIALIIGAAIPVMAEEQIVKPELSVPINPWTDIEILLKQNENGQLVIPNMNSATYCNTLADPDKGECLDNNNDAVLFYDAMSRYHSKLGKMPLIEFANRIKGLAKLRDNLWLTQIYGNLICARLINHIIYWRIAERISKATQADLDVISQLLPYYRYLAKDWTTVITSIKREQGDNFIIEAKPDDLIQDIVLNE